MLTQTAELALRSLILLGLDRRDGPTSPREMAERLDCSVSYLRKTLGLLVKAGILESVRGARGGVRMRRLPEHITLLDVIEACQGLLVANYCRRIELGSGNECAFHQAMHELHMCTSETLRRWTVAALLERPGAAGDAVEGCRLHIAGNPKPGNVARRVGLTPEPTPTHIAPGRP